MRKSHSGNADDRAGDFVSRNKRVRRTCGDDYRISAVLLELSGVAFLVAAVVYSVSTVTLFYPHSVHESDFVADVCWSRSYLAFIGVACILLPRIAGVVLVLARFLGRRMVQRSLLAALTA